MAEESLEKPPPGAYDHLQIPRCPMLGDVATFEYCRAVNRGLPCPKIVTCWGHRFNVVRYLRVHFNEEQLAGLSEPPKSKMQSLLEDIERAKRARQAEEGESRQNEKPE